MNKKAFEADSNPFGSDLNEDLGQLMSSGHYQPGEIIENVTMFDVTQLIEEVVLEEAIYDDNRLIYELDYFDLVVRPLENVTSWKGEETVSSLYFESRVKNLSFYDYKLLSEINLRYKLLKVFINNENQLCFCFPLILEGVTTEHLIGAIHSYMSDLHSAKAMIKNLVCFQDALRLPNH